MGISENPVTGNAAPMSIPLRAIIIIVLRIPVPLGSGQLPTAYFGVVSIIFQPPLKGQKQADHRFLNKRVDELIQQSFVVWRFRSPLRRNFTEDSIVLTGP